MLGRHARSNFVLFLGFAVVAIPLLLWPGQMYDGGRMSLAAEENDLSGFWLFAGRAGWEAQFGLLWAENMISDLLDVGFRSVDLVVALLSVAIVTRETMRLAERGLGFTRNQATGVGLLVLAFPGWQVLASSIHTFHAFATALGLLGVRRFVEGTSIWWTISGTVLWLSGMQLSSNLVLIPVVALIWHNPDLRPSVRLGRSSWVLLGAVALFISRRAFFPNEPPYDSYNVFINPFTPFGLRDYPENIAGFLSVILAPLVLVFLLAAVTRTPVSLRTRRFVSPALLSGASVLPYILVGKSANLRGTDEVVDWLFRHAITLAPGLALLTVAAIDQMARSAEDPRRFTRQALVLSVALLASLSLFGGLSKAGRRAFERDLADALVPALDDIPAGRLVVQGSDIPMPKFRGDEANYWSWSRLNRQDLWVELGPEAVGLGEPLPTPTSRVEVLDLVFEGAGDEACETTLVIESTGYDPASFLGLAPIGRVELLSLDSSC